MLKTYSGDRDYAERLVTSFHRFNAEDLVLYCVVSQHEIESFRYLTSSTVQVIEDSPLTKYFTDTSVHGIRPGYINQEIVKLSFWELGYAENYFCVDSEAVFVRDFRTSDFLAPDGVPYSVLVEDNDLRVDPLYFHQYGRERDSHLRRIAEEVGLHSPILKTCHGHQIFSSTVLRSFTEEFLAPRGWAYLDALAIAPYEFSWYNFWLQVCDKIPVHQREPLIKVFHTEAQHLEAILEGITSEDVARGYLGWVINSNFSRQVGSVSIDESKPHALAPYLSYGELARLSTAKLRSSFTRHFARGAGDQS